MYCFDIEKFDTKNKPQNHQFESQSYSGLKKCLEN